MKATAKGVKVSTRKVRLVADAIRNKSVDEAMRILSITQKHGSYVLLKALQSAVANSKMPQSELMIGTLIVNEGQFLKRFHASTRGRIHGYKKRTSHITIMLKEKEKTVQPMKKAEPQIQEAEIVAEKGATK